MNFVLDPEFLGGDEEEEEEGMHGEGDDDDEEDDEGHSNAVGCSGGQKGQGVCASKSNDSARPTKKKTAAKKAAADGSDDMPYVLSCPNTVASFIEMVGRYALPSAAPTKIKTLLERINACNSVHLPSKTAGTTNRDKIGRLFAIVLHYLVSVGQSNPGLFPPAEHIQAVVEALFALARDVPLAAGKAFGVALNRVFLQCVEGAHPEDETDRSRLRRRWPTVGELIMLRVTLLLFPVTDFRHPVTTPFAILLGAMLAGGTDHSGWVHAPGEILPRPFFLQNSSLMLPKKQAPSARSHQFLLRGDRSSGLGHEDQ